jgi:hypothetical protein
MNNSLKKQDGITFPAHFQEADRLKFVIQELSKGYVYSGQAPNRQDLAIMAAAVSRLITRDYPFLTNTDITEAIENGSMGRYGEVYGINLKSIDTWLRNYIKAKHEKAVEAKRQSELAEARKNQTPTVEKARGIIQLLQKNQDKVPSFKQLMNMYSKDNKNGTDTHRRRNTGRLPEETK